VAHVVSIVYRPRDAETPRPQGHYTRVPLKRALLLEFHGIEGDAKGGSGDRQVNVMCAEMLEELAGDGFKARPGELGEQLIVAGIAADSLITGARLRVGGAVLEVTVPRTGCARFEMIQGKPKQAAKGRLGVLTRVVSGGEVAVGDPVELLPAEA
jgi:MOSC domain-containing protein YiiM